MQESAILIYLRNFYLKEEKTYDYVKKKQSHKEIKFEDSNENLKNIIRNMLYKRIDSENPDETLLYIRIKLENIDDTLKSQIENHLTARYNWNATKYGHPAFLNYSFDITKNPPLKQIKKYGKPISFTKIQMKKAKLLLQYYADIANLDFNEDKRGDIEKIHLIFLNYLKITHNSRNTRGAAYYPDPTR